MSGDALTMRLVGTFHLFGQFFGRDLAGGNLGTAKCLDEYPAAQAGDLGARPLRDQAAAVQVNRRRKTDVRWSSQSRAGAIPAAFTTYVN